jgi:PAS domain S-box-containing protein
MNKILYIDDSEQTLDCLKLYIENKIKDIEVICTTNPFDAVRNIEDQNFAFILIDITMPIINGIELSKQINEKIKHCPPIVLITGYSTDDFSIDELMKYGIIDIVKKPSSPEEYSTIINKIRTLSLIYSKWIKKEEESHEKYIHNLEKFTNLISSTKSIYLILNEDNTIREASPNILELLDLDPHSLEGQNILDIVVGEDIQKLKKSLEKLTNGTAIEDLELCLKTKNPNICKWTTINANSMQNGCLTTFCLIKDITEKKMEYFKKYINEQKQKDRLLQAVEALEQKIKAQRGKYND